MPASPDFAEGAARDLVTVLEERDVATGTFGHDKEWVAVGDFRCYAEQMTGREAWEAQQRGLKKPWIFLFAEDPGVVDAVNRLSFAWRDGRTHEVNVTSSRPLGNPYEADPEMWEVEGDEDTTKTPTQAAAAPAPRKYRWRQQPRDAPATPGTARHSTRRSKTRWRGGSTG